MGVVKQSIIDVCYPVVCRVSLEFGASACVPNSSSVLHLDVVTVVKRVSNRETEAEPGGSWVICVYLSQVITSDFNKSRVKGQPIMR